MYSECKCTFELKRAWFVWFEGQNAHLSSRRPSLSGLRVKCTLQL